MKDSCSHIVSEELLLLNRTDAWKFSFLWNFCFAFQCFQSSEHSVSLYVVRSISVSKSFISKIVVLHNMSRLRLLVTFWKMSFWETATSFSSDHSFPVQYDSLYWISQEFTTSQHFVECDYWTCFSLRFLFSLFIALHHAVVFIHIRSNSFYHSWAVRNIWCSIVTSNHCQEEWWYCHHSDSTQTSVNGVLYLERPCRSPMFLPLAYFSSDTTTLHHCRKAGVALTASPINVIYKNEITLSLNLCPLWCSIEPLLLTSGMS